jgi:competence protein ComGC
MTTDEYPDADTIHEMKQQMATQQAYTGAALLVILVIIMVMTLLVGAYNGC